LLKLKALYEQLFPCPNCATLFPRALSISLSLGLGRSSAASRVAVDAADSVDIYVVYQRLRHARAYACCHKGMIFRGQVAALRSTYFYQCQEEQGIFFPRLGITGIVLFGAEHKADKWSKPVGN